MLSFEQLGPERKENFYKHAEYKVGVRKAMLIYLVQLQLNVQSGLPQWGNHIDGNIKAEV